MSNINPSVICPIQCTAGAIPYTNEKGELSMKKVKVSRYVAGKAPEYYQTDYEHMYEDEDEDHDPYLVAFPDRVVINKKADEDEEEDDDYEEPDEDDEMDRRLRRLKSRQNASVVEILEDSDSEVEDRITRHIRERQAEAQLESNLDGDQSEGMDEENEEDDETIAKRRAFNRERALAFQQDNDIPDFMDTAEDDYVEYSDEYETDSDNEKEPKLKPVFVKQSARLTIHKTKEEIFKEQEKKIVSIKRKDEQRKQNRRMIEEIKREEVEETRALDEACNAVSSDIENPNEEYELWKLRELKRIKRDREEKDSRRKEQDDIKRVREMTDAERNAEFKNNPKLVTNQQIKGKQKFMQKYYHRGSYFVSEKEEDVYQRDFTAPTLEDRFNIMNLPKVKQVKNFGRAGRTKYTHLVDQDTTDFESGWSSNNQTLKFYNNRGGGMKQVFSKPNDLKKQ